ncbi:ATP-dependent helicase, partial [Streptomyces sp. NPDC048479]
GITPHTTHVRSGEAELNRITGAQPPSGIPITVTAPVTERPKRGASSSRSRRSRPAQTRRSPAASQGQTGTSQRQSSFRSAA